MQRNTGYFPTESLEPCGNRLFSRSALNEGYLFRGSLSFIEAQGITAVIKPLLFNGLNRTIFRLSKKQHMATVLV